MSLTLPTDGEFLAFWGNEADDEDDDRIELFINLAANLLWLATGIEDDPTDSRLAFVVKYAICDMAVYLYITRDDIDAAYSPFQSERVGSYSYSKTYLALSKTLVNSPSGGTGVPFFDRVVQYFVDIALYSGGMTTSQEIFNPVYVPLHLEASVYGRIFGELDPSMGLTRRRLYETFGALIDDRGGGSV